MSRDPKVAASKSLNLMNLGYLIFRTEYYLKESDDYSIFIISTANIPPFSMDSRVTDFLRHLELLTPKRKNSSFSWIWSASLFEWGIACRNPTILHLSPFSKPGGLQISNFPRFSEIFARWIFGDISRSFLRSVKNILNNPGRLLFEWGVTRRNPAIWPFYIIFAARESGQFSIYHDFSWFTVDSRPVNSLKILQLLEFGNPTMHFRYFFDSEE